MKTKNNHPVTKSSHTIKIISYHIRICGYDEKCKSSNWESFDLE